MKNFRGFLLMVMLPIAMVHTASLKCDPLLRDIICDVEHIFNHTFDDFPVEKPSDETQGCVPGFFCLAAKSLDPVQNSSIPGMKRLHRQIAQYAIQENQKECTLSNSKIGIKTLLATIKECAEHENATKKGHVVHCKL